MRYTNWEKISGCTLEEREELIPYISQLIDLKSEFEKKGIYGFDKFIESSTNLFEKVALDLIIQGTMPDLCETALFTLLNSSKLDNSQYLKDIIFAEFVLNVQKGSMGNQELKIILLPYLGVDCSNELIIGKNTV